MTFSKPSQLQLKQYLEDRRTNGGPPPTPEEIRRMLGWELVQAERDNDRRKP